MSKCLESRMGRGFVVVVFAFKFCLFAVNLEDVSE